MKWILIITIWYNGHGVAIHTQEFYSKDACLGARAFWLAAAQTQTPAAIGASSKFLVCTPKG